MLVFLRNFENLVGFYLFETYNLYLQGFENLAGVVTHYSVVITIVACFNPFALAVNSNLPDLSPD